MTSVLVEAGPLKGWRSWSRRGDLVTFGTALGPICWREDEDGQVRVRIDTSPHHRNVEGALHGGFLMGFADMSLYAIAWRSLEATAAVTLTLNCEFMGAGEPGLPLEARGEVLKETGRLLFLRGVISQSGSPIVSYSGTLRKSQGRPHSAPAGRQD